MSEPVVVLVLVHDEDLGVSLADDLRTLLEGHASVEIVRSAIEVIDRVHAVDGAGGIVPVAFVQLHRVDDWGVDAVMRIQEDELAASTRSVLITKKLSLRGVDRALQVGAVQGMITRPWTMHSLNQILEANLATFLVEHAPDRLDEFDALLDEEDRRRARERVAQQVDLWTSPPSKRHPLIDDTIDDDEMEAELVRLLDNALGHPPRLRVSPGTVLIEAGEDVGGFYVVLDGVVQLTSSTETGEKILHENSTGQIIGLLSLASHRRAMLQCRAVTEVRAIPVTLDQLQRAIDAEPELSGLLTRVLISSLARRLRRSDQLQVELDQSLAALSAARAQLVANAKFTTLGEISAGMAHELNNPTAALIRGIEHLGDDLAAVIDDPTLDAVVQRQLEASSPSTAELRERRRTIASALGDRPLADRLIEIGVDSVEEARELAGSSEAELHRLRAAARLGDTVRNVSSAAERIQELVESLRAYARGDDGRGAFQSDVPLADSVTNALRLLSHRLHDVEVVLHIEDRPLVRARPGPLQQIWTNLMTNALDAMDDHGTMTVRIALDSSERAVVEVGDSGPGIAPALQPKIFEPRFTTKDGKVQFGMGLGLSISRQLVDDHGGTIDFVSEPGQTVFTVTLPCTGAGDAVAPAAERPGAAAAGQRGGHQHG